MSAEILRAAASKMRERAEAATTGPWSHDGDGEVGRYSRDLNIGWMVAHPPLVADAEHIASWHPAVALAVADWLEEAAGDLDRRQREVDGLMAGIGATSVEIDTEALQPAALAVARAYLGEAS